MSVLFHCSPPVFVCLSSNVWPLASEWVKELVSWISILSFRLPLAIWPMLTGSFTKTEQTLLHTIMKNTFLEALRRKCVKQSTIYWIISQIQSTAAKLRLKTSPACSWFTRLWYGRLASADCSIKVRGCGSLGSSPCVDKQREYGGSHRWLDVKVKPTLLLYFLFSNTSMASITAFLWSGLEYLLFSCRV